MSEENGDTAHDNSQEGAQDTNVDIGNEPDGTNNGVEREPNTGRR